MKFLEQKQMQNFYGIYKIVQISTQKVYVGQTKMLFKKRYWHHCWKLRQNCHDNRHLQSAWNKNGEEDFYFEVIFTANEEDDLNQKEEEFIKETNSFIGGFNMTLGGEGKKLCPMSEQAKKIVGEKNRIHNLGKKHSEITRQRMRDSSPHRKLTEEQLLILKESRIGSKHSEETKKIMRQKKLGSKNKVSKLNEEKAKIIKELLMESKAMTEIGKMFEVSAETISAIKSNITWKHVEVEGWNEFIKKIKK